MKSKAITSIALIAVGIALGVPLGYLVKKEKLIGELVFKDGNLYTEGNILFYGGADFKLIYEVVHSVEIEGTSINGQIVSISVEDVAEIAETVKKIDGVDPILSIRVIDRENVEVRTGVVRGPMDGGGRIYSLKKVTGEWELDESKGTAHWLSKTKGEPGESGQLRSLRSLRATS
ncbi:hypothetical protein DDZ13_15040 [Coraliomargarita sinensis]|uniref:Uncharacterized protein n=2 Tax=Coraliomargarita sinensis TaxID=2174842 RepID=A0A317ZHJ7_9BACT|nr:hypothetical protein DDZ13_15040 [Coraliomargarita sinensis]